MRLTLYYLTHTFVNQIRKLFRTWVVVFLLACLLFGVLIGLGAGALASLFEEEALPEDSITEELPEEDLSEVPLLDEATRDHIVELVAGGIALAVLFFSAFSADKSGSAIFLMADANLLFQAPLLPQSVLLFRLIMQAGTSFVATLYLLFQIPNLVLNLGLGIGTAFAMLAVWFFLLLYAKLISVLLYTVASTHTSLKKRLRPTLYVCVGVLALAFLAFSRTYGGNYFAAAIDFFNAPVTRFIPVWGWLKGAVLFSITGDPLGLSLSFGALAVFAVLLIVLIRYLRADFYEEALARSEETAAAQQAAQQDGKGIQKRKKDRSERLTKKTLSRGYGATVYFHKAMYNRFRFAPLCVLTKTTVTYLVIALLMGLFHLPFVAVALVLGGFSFFRSLGNPIAADLSQDHFHLAPDTAHRKVFFSFLAGITCSAMDLAPAFLLSALLLRVSPPTVLLWLLLVLSVGTYADSVGMFIDLSLSTGLSQTVKSLVQILFVYFGLIPTAVLIVLGFAFDKLVLFATIAIALNLLITAVSLLISPLFMEQGRK